MLRNKLISLLIKEGFSHKTLSAFTDPQLKQLAKKILSEVEKSTVQKTTYSKSEVDQMKRNHGGVSVDDGTVTPHEDGSVTVTQDMSEEDDIETDKMGNPDVEIDGKDLLLADKEMSEEAVSQSQYNFYQLVHKCKTSKYKDCGDGRNNNAVLKAAKEMSLKSIEDYTNTPNPDSLPDKVSESLEKWVTSLVENDNNDEVISKKNIMELLTFPKMGMKKQPMMKTDLFDSMEQEVSFDRLNRMVLQMDGYELKIDELEKGEDDEESVLLMYLNSPTGHVWDIAIFTDGNIYMDNAPINDMQDFEEEIREKESRSEGELSETKRDTSGEYIGAPVDTQSPTTVPVKPGIKSPPKPSRPGPFKRPKTTPKPKAKNGKTPDWFGFDEIKSDVEKKK